MRARLQAFLTEAKSRKLTRTFTIYTSTALTVLGAVSLFSSHYDLPGKLFDVVLIILVCGLPSALLIAWFHGKPEKQKIQKREITIHTVLGLTALILIIRIMGAPAVTPAPAGEKSIAVLPFKNLSDSKEDEYFSDGIMEDILTQLSRIAALRVISRSSVIPYKNSSKNVSEIGHELGVSAILEGSVRRAGDRVRITSHLINVSGDNYIWAESYDREMKDIFAIQSDVAQQIAIALRARLSPDERQRIEKKATENLDAYGLYLRGRDFYNHFTEEDIETAVGFFKKALELDPHYALAYAGLGDAYDRRAAFGMGDAWIDSAIAVSNVALSLDPNLAEGYKAMGSAYQSKWELQRSLDLYGKAVELNPNFAAAISNIGIVNYRLGKYDEALRWIKKAATLEPGFARWSSNVGLQYFSLGDDSLATVWFHKALELQPEFFFPRIVLTYISLYAGDIERAREEIDSLLEMHPDVAAVLDAAGDVRLLAGDYRTASRFYRKATGESSPEGTVGNKLAYTLLRLGHPVEADRILDRNLSMFLKDSGSTGEGSSNPYGLAQIYAIRRKKMECLVLLQKAADLGYLDYRWTIRDPLLENVRGEQQFDRILAGLKVKIDEMRAHVATMSEDLP